MNNRASDFSNHNGNANENDISTKAKKKFTVVCHARSFTCFVEDSKLTEMFQNP